MADRHADARQSDPTALGKNVKIHTVGGNTLESTAGALTIKGVFFSADGTCTVDNHDGTGAVAGVPFLKGLPLPFIPNKVTAVDAGQTCFLACD